MAAGIGACPLSPSADIPNARTAGTSTIGTCTDHDAAEWQAAMEALILWLRSAGGPSGVGSGRSGPSRIPVPRAIRPADGAAGRA